VAAIKFEAVKFGRFCNKDSLWKPSAFTLPYRALLVRRSLDEPNFFALASQLLRVGASFSMDDHAQLM